MLDPGKAEGRGATHECDADLDFSSLVFGISRGDALPEGRGAAYTGLILTSGMVSGPAL